MAIHVKRKNMNAHEYLTNFHELNIVLRHKTIYGKFVDHSWQFMSKKRKHELLPHLDAAYCSIVQAIGFMITLTLTLAHYLVILSTCLLFNL